MKRYLLEYRKGLLQTTIFNLNGEATIGRSRKNDFWLLEPLISRNHAKLTFNSGQWMIEDLNSRNGTLVNGQQIQTKLLLNGDHIQLGSATLRFVELETQEESHSLADTEDAPASGHIASNEAYALGIPQQIDEQMHLVRAFMDALPTGVAILNDKTEVLYFNRASQRLRGRFEEGSLGLLLRCSKAKAGNISCGSLTECAKCALHTAIRKAFEEGNPTLGMEIPWPQNNGATAGHFRFSLLLLPYLLRDEPLALLTWEDITPQRLAEQALRDNEEKYRLLVENANEAILVAQEGMLRFVNSRTTELSGYSEEELKSRPFVEFIHPDDREKVVQNHLKRLGGEPVPPFYAFRIVCKDGDIRWVEISAVVVSWEGGPATLNFLSDITEKRQLEEELLRAQKIESLGVLAGGIAHDFNNILTAILGNVSLAKLEVKRGDRIFELLEGAEAASSRARALTQQLLTFSKGGAPVKKMASIAEIIKESSSFALRGSKVRCDFNMPDDLWHVEVDTAQISQVIHNLIINADQALPEGGVINVAAQNETLQATNGLPLEAGRYIKISIEDHGIGIPQEHLPKIFDPYFSTKQKGSGLGLATVYSIIKRHNGHITAESQLGLRTTFHIYLPASEGEYTDSGYEQIKFLEGEGTVLVMDDEELLRRVSGQMLTHLGYAVEFAQDGAEAIKVYQKAKQAGKPFDVVIVDLTVPGGMGGKEAIKKLREIDPEVTAIVSSGYSNDPIMSDFKEHGFSGVVAKPYDLRELGEVLSKVIRQKAE